MGNLLKDKVCLITGTTKGIGKKTAEIFAAEGAIVYASARTEGCLESWAQQENARGAGSIQPIYFDVANSDEIKRAVLRLKREQGRLDILINNAGRVQNELLGMISLQKTREMFDVNVLVFWSSRSSWR